MNCLTARQTLNLVRPGETAVPRLDDAVEHIDACPACQIAVHQQEQFDRKVGEMVRDVAVPVGPKERLLARLETTENCDVAAPTVPPDHAAVVQSSAKMSRSSAGSRRRWFAAVSVVAAGCVVAALGAWSLWPRPQKVELGGVIEQVANSNLDAMLLPVFTQFGGGLAAKDPITMETRWLSRPASRLQNMDVAVYFFTLGGPGGKKLQGRLAVIPKRIVKAADLPAASNFLAGEPTYTKTGFCITTWVEGDFVYVCCLSGNGLDRLKKRHEAA